MSSAAARGRAAEPRAEQGIGCPDRYSGVNPASALLPRKPPAAAVGRVFLVGYPRSGTTLLQSMLFGHPEVVSFPETFFFDLVTPAGRLARNLGFASGRSAEAYAKLAEIGILEGTPARPPRRLRRCGEDLAAALDAATRKEGGRLWIEKTPLHLRFTRQIRRYVPAARFVHIIREGTGAIPSLHDVRRRFPQEWDGPRSIEQCAARWERELALSAACAGKPGHAFVSYERLAEHPVEVLEALCASLGLATGPDIVESMLASRAGTLSRVAREEPWKRGVGGSVQKRGDEKLDRLAAADRDKVLAAAEGCRPLLNEIPFV